MPVEISSCSLHLSPVSAISYSKSNFASQSSRFNAQILNSRQFSSKIYCLSTRPAKKSSMKTDKILETKELVSLLMKNFSDKRPLITTLDKYVKVMRVDHCFLLFEELGKTDKWLQCLEVFRWMQKQRWYMADNGVYSKLISVMGKKGQTRMAMWLFSEMRSSGCKPDTSVYNALITAHLHSRDKSKALSKAIGYLEKMKGMERCKPNIVTYNILLRAFAQARNTVQVELLFKDLEESIISPDIFTFNGVMDGYGKNGMITEMESILSRMKSKQIKPDVITFNLLIDAYGRKQEFEKMEQVYKSFLRSKEKPTISTFNSMITNYGKARLRERAEFIFNKMTEMGYVPNFITYECLIVMYGYCDCISRAREVFDEMVGSGKEVKTSTLNVMLDAYCVNGLQNEADKLFGSASSIRVPVNSSTYKLLYKAYSKGNMKGLLENLLKEMDRNGVIPNKRFFLDALGAVGSSSSSSQTRLVGSSSSQTRLAESSSSSSQTRLKSSTSVKAREEEAAG
ncbi:pentatricopeptide repeat-containing protein At4g39620, chloroplastic-like [Impatiens glandulifera]|uniref:pentatricopeptide repeat-containing protein At4g39620, chloroplastic-like n=1 Tax=Impatiens glandulifera TaxID=253017 RepID=UPI001FB18144|nr:pentatricopeptide repeat-containing protein At4g39620, chloroplastic-like [Impatiens glandulifera]